MWRACCLMLALSVAAGMSACGTTQVELRYAKSPHAVMAAADSPALQVGRFVDQRGEPEHWLGAIRGGFGNPLKNLESSVPVSKLVEKAFAEALQARQFSLPASGAAFQVAGVIKRLDCNQIIQREANADFDVTVTDLASGKVIFTRTYTANNAETALMSSGVFASPEDLRAITERTLHDAVNRALDDPDLRKALRR